MSEPIIVDLFAGGGGASTGIARALGRDPHVAVNHDAAAIAMHQANHPDSQHFRCNVWEVDPRAACAGRPVDLLWASPDCKHFSKAKGGKPVEKGIRALAWVVPRWAAAVRPRVIILENVEEFATWGPLVDGRPCPKRKGETFRRWLGRLRKLGYQVEAKELRACDFGAPTSRKRLFVVARCDGLPIVWPTPTHGPGRAHPFRTAADCIDWSIPCPSIFEREQPLKEATLRRIARGIWKFVINSPRPFVVPIAFPPGGPIPNDSARAPSLFHAGIVPLMTKGHSHGWDRDGGPCRPADQPHGTVVATDSDALIAASLVQTSWGEREGQAPRCMDPQAPLGTIVGGGIKHALVAAFLAKNYGGHETPGAPVQLPLSTITTQDHHALVASNLVKLRGTCTDGQPVDVPAATVTASGTHLGEVRAFLTRYNGTSIGQPLQLPLTTIDTRDRFGLVTVDGAEYAIADIGFRMLTPRELFRAQGFPEDYVIDPRVGGKPLGKTAQVRCAGNSVCPPLAEALVRANVLGAAKERAA